MRIFLTFAFILHFQIGHTYQSYENVSQKLTSLFSKVDKQEISVSEALITIDENDIDLLLKPSVISTKDHQVIAEGKIACNGAVQGILCFNLNELEQFKQKNMPVIWVTESIKNDDLCHLSDFAGIFALNEDPSSHAIIVTRVYNIPCVTLPMHVRKNGNELITPTGVYKNGEAATLDAFNGILYAGNVPLQKISDSHFLDRIMEWCEKYACLEVHGNADNAKEAKESLFFGAKGVDPRTEHMFFHPDRLHLFRKLILSKGEDEIILNELKELQKQDFIDLFQAMKSFPVKIRLLDPPLHEFLPEQEHSIAKLANDLNIPMEELKFKIKNLQETNPMMGHRGIRLLLTYPHILKMQVRAIFEAALDPSLETSLVTPHIVIPMVIGSEEVIQVRKLVDEVYKEILVKKNKPFIYKLGIMMETPRACLLSSEIAPWVDFISFGTNDLTGQTLALSRGDVYDKFLKFYLDQGLLKADPFSEIDPAVKELMGICVSRLRTKNEDIVIGICGEQASQKTGVFICHQLGFDSVSCAAFRIPAVKLFAAQAAILHPDFNRSCIN